jgi:uncharacterized protein (DUF58 family)
MPALKDLPARPRFPALAALTAAISARMTRWMFRWQVPEQSVVLIQRRVYILPSRYGVIFAASLMMMLTGSINYNLSLGFILTFLLGALGVNAILHTFRNLAQLKILPGRAAPVFAGDLARFTLTLQNPGALDRYAVGIRRDKHDITYVDVPARQSISAEVALPAPQRGLMPPGRLTIFTRFPLGLCYAWAYVDLAMQCLVYPRPEAAGIALPPLMPHDGEGIEHGSGREDFSGLRPYQAGDSQRHIAWKAVARGETLQVKQFSGRAAAELWLDWAQLPSGFDTEARLSRLARWVIDAHAAGVSFGLRLPGTELPPAPGDAQRERCLEALALFEQKSTAL